MSFFRGNRKVNADEPLLAPVVNSGTGSPNRRRGTISRPSNGNPLNQRATPANAEEPLLGPAERYGSPNRRRTTFSRGSNVFSKVHNLVSPLSHLPKRKYRLQWALWQADDKTVEDLLVNHKTPIDPLALYYFLINPNHPYIISTFEETPENFLKRTGKDRSEAGATTEEEKEVVRARELRILNLLLDHNANQERYEGYDGALESAIKSKRLDYVQTLLRRGGNVNKYFNNACYSGNLDIVKEFLSSDGHEPADVNFIDTTRFDTPLYAAIGGLNIDIVRLLVSLGAKINARGPKPIEVMPIDALAYVNPKEHARIEEIVKFLLSSDGHEPADINAVDKHGDTILHKIWEQASRVYPGYTDLTHEDWISMIRVILLNGFDINITNNFGVTVFMSVATTPTASMDGNNKRSLLKLKVMQELLAGEGHPPATFIGKYSMHYPYAYYRGKSVMDIFFNKPHPLYQPQNFSKHDIIQVQTLLKQVARQRAFQFQGEMGPVDGMGGAGRRRHYTYAKHQRRTKCKSSTRRKV